MSKHIWAILRPELNRLRLKEVEAVRSALIFARTHSEVWPYFSPQVIQKDQGFQILGSVGMCIQGFETWWARILKEVYSSKGIGNDYLFALFITNIPTLRDPPIFPEHDLNTQKLKTWLGSIARIVGSLPDTNVRLIGAIEGEPVVDGFSLKSFYCHPVKVYAFRLWSERNLPEIGQLLQTIGPPARTDPYDELFELIHATH